MTDTDDFRQLSWDEVVAMHRRAAEGDPVEDAEFTVEDPGEEPPQWQVWAETYPWREADARRYLEFEAESHDVYWYRDRRGDRRQYGMPSLKLVRRANARFERRAAVDAKRWTYALRWVGVYFIVSVGLVGAFGPVVIWSWFALPLLALWFGRKRRLAAEVDYMKLAEARFDEFLSDAEIEERRRALIATGATAAGFYALHKIRQWDRHLRGDQ